ncbi:hypothetical protein V6N11_022037 [Hibiscus sabdariffa]|uniref:Integrase catalytic domain-containing protein n=1 Tax=Hibiscus sabdariffa TaxID=183260 RepID=A0ABR2TIK9_9ROSI
MANNTISLRSLLEKEKLNGINFLDWFHNLRIVLKQERKEYVIEEAVPNDPGANAPSDKDKFKKHMDNMLDVGCLMLATMTPELQKQHEDMVAYEMIQNLKEIYEGQARQERYETSKALFQCKMSEGSPVRAHVIKMMGYIQTLEKLGLALNDELAIDVVLQSLPNSFSQLILNFNMNEIEKTLPQLLGMLRTGEGNCPIYLEEVKKAKAVGASVLESTWQKYQSSSIRSRTRILEPSFDELLKECGIVSQLTPPGTPQWNGVSERRNRTLLDMVRSMMSHNDLPTSFWGYALETAAFTLNRVPSKSVQKTPHEMWTGKRPNVSFMKIWGCKAYVKHQMSTTLESKSEKCTFVGYPKETKGYYFYNENKVYVARTGVFLEKEFLTNSGKGRNIELEEVQQQQVIEPEVEEISQAVGKIQLI